MKKIALYILLALALIAIWTPRAPATETITIETAKGKIAIRAELALTPQQQEQGLMHRQSLPDNHGMLFVFSSPREARLWMKDTLIPLDMLFIENDGRIVHIHKNAAPGSLTEITSGQSVVAVLEMPGGFADKNGIAPGDTLRSTHIK